MVYTVATRLDSDQLYVSLRSEETCKTIVVPVYRKEAHIARQTTADPFGRALAPTTTLTVGLALGGVGIYSYLDADRLAATSGESSPHTPSDYRSAGVVSAAAGAGLLAISLIDAIRLRDTVEVVGNVDGAPDVRDEACHGQTVRNTRVAATALEVALPWRAEAVTDGSGEVRLDLHALPDAAFANTELPLALRVGDAGTLVPLRLAAEPTRRLLAALAADATSQVARDREARAAALCAARIAAASTSAVDDRTTDGELDQFEARWTGARDACGSRWEPAHEQQLLAFRSQRLAVAAQRARNQCAAAKEEVIEMLEDRFASGERVEIDALRDALAERCSGASNAAETVASFSARASQQVKARARAARAAAAASATAAAKAAAARTRDVSEPPSEPSLLLPQRSCCKICRKGCPCGNTCIACSKTCHVGPGCAC